MKLSKILAKLTKTEKRELIKAMMDGSVFISGKNDVEFLYNIFNGEIQVGMGGEWWNGKIKLGRNTLHHKKEKIDEAYKPVTVHVVEQGHSIVFHVMGGFYSEGQTFEVKAIAK